MGGSFGIALINTYIAHRVAYNRTTLVSHVAIGDRTTGEWLRQAAGRMMAHGATVLEASRKALAALEATVVRQTFLLSYMDAFLLLALLNACCIPLVVITIRRKKAAGAAPAAGGAGASTGGGASAREEPVARIELEAH